MDQPAFLPAGAAHFGNIRPAQSRQFAGGVGELVGVKAVEQWPVVSDQWPVRNFCLLLNSRSAVKLWNGSGCLVHNATEGSCELKFAVPVLIVGSVIANSVSLAATR